MFRMWQVFIFSLVPLALVFTGVIIASMDGVDSEPEDVPTQPAASGPPPAPPEVPPGGTALQLTASNQTFNVRTLTAQSAAPVVVQVNNTDPGVQHNFAVYNNRSASQSIFVGDLVAGPAVTTYSFTAPPPGSYFFRCDAHPDDMTGTFTSR
jgi:Cupredoxin-like domain